MAMHIDSIGWKRLPSSFSSGKEEGDSGMYSNHFFPEEDEVDNQQLHQNQNNNNDGLLHASASSPMGQHQQMPPHHQSGTISQAPPPPDRRPPNRQPPPRRIDHTYRDYSNFPETELQQVKKMPTNFPSKLHLILSTPEYANAISWMPHGRAWKIHNKELLMKDVVPNYFVQSKYESFTRQLNGWGFKRLHQSGNDFNCYYHECFLRGLSHLVPLMNRVPGNLGKLLPHVEGEPNFYEIAQQFPLHDPVASPQMMPFPPHPPSSHHHGWGSYGHHHHPPPPPPHMMNMGSSPQASGGAASATATAGGSHAPPHYPGSPGAHRYPPQPPTRGPPTPTAGAYGSNDPQQPPGGYPQYPPHPPPYHPYPHYYPPQQQYGGDGSQPHQQQQHPPGIPPPNPYYYPHHHYQPVPQDSGVDQAIVDAYSIPTPVGKSEQKQNKINAGDVLISSEDPTPVQSPAPGQGQVAGAATEEFAPLTSTGNTETESSDPN